MAKKNTEEVKTKLIVKLFNLKSEANSIGNCRRFLKTIERLRVIESRYNAMTKKSIKDLVIGRDLVFASDMTKLKKMDLEELKEYI